jgi:hypothetical protein
VPEHAQRRVVRPAGPGRFGGVLRDLGQIDVRHEILRVGALQHHDPNALTGNQFAQQGHEVPHQFRSDEVHRWRVDHDTNNALVGPGHAQRAVRIGHRRLLRSTALGSRSLVLTATLLYR